MNDLSHLGWRIHQPSDNLPTEPLVLYKGLTMTEPQKRMLRIALSVLTTTYHVDRDEQFNVRLLTEAGEVCIKSDGTVL